ncbi:uncharacterized protein K02A2.6-like [Harmonia axyridis]|uniref:uncharacterized protein K02A2.6-like n=1 Tax=Harmonia axyridis TaxID=115357 RepID=UPI001E279853|nr:uncharacterized protein K02A2.6-like [Harmonia axyridis]
MAAIGHLREFNVSVSDWTIYKVQLTNYFAANNITDPAIKRAIFLNCCSESSFQLLNSLCIPDTPQDKDFNNLLKYFDTYFAPAKLVFPERQKFYNCSKAKEESVQEWAARVRQLASRCNFKTAELSTILRDKFIMGFEKGPIMDRLFEEDETKLTFEMAIEVACRKEATCKTEVAFGNVKKEEMEMYYSKTKLGPEFPEKKSKHGYERKLFEKKRTTECDVCGKVHYGLCRYRNFICNLCGNKGHLAKKCSKVNSAKNHFLNLEDNTTESHDQSMNFDIDNDLENQLFHLNTSNVDPIFVDVFVNNVPVKFELDTGAGASVISERFKADFFSNLPLLSCTEIFQTYDGKKIHPLGKIDVCIGYRGRLENLFLYVVENGGPPLLGRDFLNKFSLGINKMEVSDNRMYIENFHREFPNVFTNKLGLFNKGKIHLKLEEGSIPKFFKPRPIAFALKEKVEKEIDRLVEENILTPVDYSDYATPIVPVLKSNGSVRICGDYSVTLNPNLEIDKFPLPRIEELFTKLQSGTIFTKIDLSSAFQQVELDDESKKLTTISTHRGLFFYNRLPFGIHSGPSKFQKIMEKVVVGFEDVTCFQDDILISSKDIKEHIDKVRSVLHKMSECGLTVEKSKCDFFKPSVAYVGYIIDKNGLHKSKEKIDAILKVPYPQNVTQLKSFLGMVNYYNRFIPNASSLLKPLYKLLQKNSSWKFDTACVHSFETVKRVLGSETILVHFNSQQTVHLFVDASQYGLGAVIMHIIEGSFRPIAYASRTLSQSELKYSQIEKEAAAIILPFTY